MKHDYRNYEPERGNGRPAKKGANKRNPDMDGDILPPEGEQKVPKSVLEARKGKESAEDAVVVDETTLTLHAPAGANIEVTVTTPKDPTKSVEDFERYLERELEAFQAGKASAKAEDGDAPAKDVEPAKAEEGEAPAKDAEPAKAEEDDAPVTDAESAKAEEGEAPAKDAEPTKTEEGEAPVKDAEPTKAEDGEVPVTETPVEEKASAKAPAKAKAKVTKAPTKTPAKAKAPAKAKKAAKADAVVKVPSTALVVVASVATDQKAPSRWPMRFKRVGAGMKRLLESVVRNFHEYRTAKKASPATAPEETPAKAETPDDTTVDGKLDADVAESLEGKDFDKAEAPTLPESYVKELKGGGKVSVSFMATMPKLDGRSIRASQLTPQTRAMMLE